MDKRMELIMSVGWAIMAVIVASYCALMLNRSAQTFRDYREVALANHALILEQQRIGLANQELFKEHMKHDQEVLAELQALNLKPRPREK
jgi:hypothetical protein